MNLSIGGENVSLAKLHSTISRAFNPPGGPTSWLLRLRQEVQVLKKLLQEKGLWDEARYKRP
jgi:hypothetical protein